MEFKIIGSRINISATLTLTLVCASTIVGLHRFWLRNSNAAMDVGRSAFGNNRWTQVRLLRHRRVLGLQERGERLRLSGALLPLQADVSDGSSGTQGRAVCRHHHDSRCRTARRCSDGQVSVICDKAGSRHHCINYYCFIANKSLYGQVTVTK